MKFISEIFTSELFDLKYADYSMSDNNPMVLDEIARLSYSDGNGGRYGSQD